MTGNDMFWFDLKTNFDLELFLIDPEDEVFVPMSMFPISPAVVQIKKNDNVNSVDVQQKVLIKKEKEGSILNLLCGIFLH